MNTPAPSEQWMLVPRLGGVAPARPACVILDYIIANPTLFTQHPTLERWWQWHARTAEAAKEAR